MKKSKKVWVWLLVLCMVLTAVPLTVIADTNEEFSYWVLSETDKTCTITGYTGESADLQIPSEIHGYTVTIIGPGVFENCTELTSVIIPDSVTTISGYTFSDCISLTSVTIPDSVTAIMDYAFNGCTGLTSITIPDNVIKIGVGVFDGCSGLTDVTIPSSVKIIDEGPFARCSSLTNIQVAADSTTYSSENGILFNKDKTALVQYPTGKPVRSYMIPESVTQIMTKAFSGCEVLENIIIPNSVTDLGGLTFFGCTKLTNVVIPESVTSIGFRVFGNCTGLTSFVIPNSVTKIGMSAFSGCTELARVVIPESVTEIQDNKAFDNCEKLTICGYAGSYAENYAAKEKIPFNQIFTPVQTDSDTAVSIGGGVPQDGVLNIKTLKNTQRRVEYEITIMKDGVAVQPDGTVTVRIPVSAAMNPTGCKVYREEADKTYTDVQAFYLDGYMVFNTDHLSKYVMTIGNINGDDVIYGDTNGDSFITTDDALKALQYAVRKISLTDEQIKAADVNGEAGVTTADALAILQRAVGKISKFVVEG